ncbi:MAG: hypothetical protein HY906_10440, partial [Deltaproteobacteria bacterium]|nr:hypothetical protein [Deltaproteobacteria bacterium]
CSGTNVASVSCSNGLCNSSCNPGYGNCTQPAYPVADNGCETNTGTNVDNCGQCGRACSLINVATRSCSGGTCNSTCNAGYGNCGQPSAPTADDGCETGTSSNTAHCGGCGRACSGTNVASVSCSNGLCNSSCNPGYGNCTQPAFPTGDDGCEINTNTSTTHCGGCGRPCSSTNVAPLSCSTGTCNSTCSGLYGNCTQPAYPTADNGCETATNTLTNCGGCGVPCSRANATATCATGTCQIASCNGGYYNVDGIDGNGCECQDDGQNTCATAVGLGALLTGQSVLSQVRKVVPNAVEDWYTVTFTPVTPNNGGGAPQIAFVQNDGGEFKFDVFYVCGGGAAGCRIEGGTAVGVTSWYFDENFGTPGYTTRDWSWPTTVYVKVYRPVSGLSCASYQLQAAR